MEFIYINKKWGIYMSGPRRQLDVDAVPFVRVFGGNGSENRRTLQKCIRCPKWL
jgi:hypothetical protein